MPINAHSIKLSHLRALLAVAKHGNFTEAALQLEMSQSAISHAIATLEEHLGVAVVLRGRHGAHLTLVGQQIANHAREIMQGMEAIARVAEVARGVHGGQVRISSFRSVASQLLPGIIARFHQQFPAIAINLIEHDDCPDVEQSLREGRSDIGFTLLPASSDIEAWEILRDEFIVLLPPSVTVPPPALTWEVLVAQPLILPPIDYPMIRQLHDHVRDCGYVLQGTYEVETDGAIVSLVAKGIGSAILPRLAAEPIAPSIQVYSLPKPLARVIGVAVLAQALHPPIVHAFLDSLKAESSSRHLNW
jgi:DNA-binding transcriptional LysR family regulator